MEDPPAGQALTWQEKEKLKEKLAFLKREYSKTFNRLQRAQRAERVKSYVKKTVAEQNRLLRQEETEKNTTELMDKQSPSGGNKPETCRLQTNTCSHSDAEKKMSVTFKLEPEFFNNEVNLQESSCAEGTNGGQENVLRGLVRSVIEENQNQLPRNRMTSVSEGRESACDLPPSSAGERLENQMASTEEPRSPIFKRRNNISDSKNSIQKAPRQVTVREEKCLTPQDPQLGDLQDVPKENVFLRVPRALSHMLMGGSNVQQPVSPFAEDICDSCEPTPQCSVNNIHVSLENFEDMGKELACVENQMENECMSREELCRTSDLTSDNQPSLAGRSNPSPNESRTHKERSHNETSHSCPLNSVSILDNTEEPLGNQETQIEARSPVLEKTPPAAESVLNTCTMVEGLLFPVEYYVRTTRRMSNCQRKVDLEAVILSQLGRSRKGLRNKCKQINSNPDQLSQETARSDVQLRGTPFPFLGAESDPVSSSSSSQKSLPSSDESSTSNGSLSQNSIISTKRAKGRSWRREKGRQGFNCRPALNVSQAHPESSDLSMPKENSPHLSSEKENCDGDLEKSPIGKTKVLVTATDETIEAEMSDVIWPAEADLPDGSQTFGKWHQPSLEYIKNPLQGNNFLNPSDEAFPSHTQGLEANVNVCQADKQPVEHLKNQYLQKACRAEQLPMVKESLPQRDPSSSSVKRKARQGSKGKRGRSQQMDLDDPAPLGHLGLDSVSSDPPFHFQNEMLSLKWLPSKMDIREFHLPDEEFGLLKFEKLQSCTMKKLEPFVPSGSEHWLQSAGDSLALRDTRLKQMNTEGKSLEKSFISPSKTVSPKLSHLEGQLHKKGLSHRELLLTPASIVSAGATNQLESQIPTPAFPVLGTSPAILSRVHSDTLPVLPWQVETNFFREPASLVMEGKECYDSTGVLRSDSCRAGSDCRPDEAVTLKEYQPPGSGSKECCSAENTMTAEQLAVAPSDNLREGSLHLASKLKNPSSSCAVDVSTVWWESAGCAELCIVTACETSISLWKPLASSQWRKMYTWHLTEIPVIQIVSLPDVHNLVCVALGDLEIGELRVLLCSSEDGSLKQSLVKTGSIKAVLGLTDRRLVSSSGTLQDQQIEVISVSTAGRSNERQTLMPPEDTILAFAEVEGIRDALVGTTAVNILIVWNLKTGQILKKMPVGYSYPASICHRAYSDSGLLFVVLSRPHAKEHESCGNPAFWMSVLNPKTARSTRVMFFSLPPGHSGRYLEGEVKGASAAAVLTSGTIAVWDLFLGQCTALLPPNTDGNWSLVRWSVTDSYLLAGQKDGSVYVYDYSQTKAKGK